MAVPVSQLHVKNTSDSQKNNIKYNQKSFAEYLIVFE